MPSYAVVRQNVVQDIIDWDGDPNSRSLPYECEAVLNDGSAHIGCPYIDGVFYAPASLPVPQSVTPLQMRKALREMGLRATVAAFVSAQSDEVQEAWEYANSIDRDNELIAMAQAALGMTDEQADDLFRLAASL